VPVRLGTSHRRGESAGERSKSHRPDGSVQAEEGPQKLQDVIEATEKLSSVSQQHAQTITELESKMKVAAAAIEAQRAVGTSAITAVADTGRAVSSMSARLDGEAKRLQKYADRAVEPLARTTQVCFMLA
jgi:Zn-dependent alcohol dehydrogenase